MILHTDQVILEIIEAVSLKAADISGLANPYCEIKLKNHEKAMNQSFFSKAATQKTYYCEKTLLPKWYEQKFVMDVPMEAANCLRGYSIAVKVKSFGLLGKDSLLGQTDVQMHSLRNQHELTGWFPLRSHKGESSTDHKCGSIRIRMHWIYTAPALLNYFLLLSKGRLEELRKNKEHMQQQLSAVEDKAKVSERSSLIPWSTISSLGKPIRSKSSGHKLRVAPTPREHQNKLSSEKSKSSGRWSLSLKSTKAAFPDKAPSQHSRVLRKSYLWSLNSQTLEGKQKQIVHYSTQPPDQCNEVGTVILGEMNKPDVVQGSERADLAEYKLSSLCESDS